MATSEVGILTPLFLCVLLLGSTDVEYAEGKICRPKYCDPRVSYMSCPPSGAAPKEFFQFVTCYNCCELEPGCKLFDAAGSVLCTGISQ
ncbi:PREDICTED: proteinase inhibitor PSI-1.2-like [Nicotiana attenuata]|uniref:Proteinase inhibitor type-2 cevi57 n=1 Tax=Nicotiana attenuata TaxID=49451 RepID=A0A314KVL0_NICAT|nr:PREDICTED: proteinase inhibitor PSI-1.2-like [Nicotiana attenuata]OIT33418.1 proteinase inhibitor type-2 cevi57 [Nicotiana attenuata]